MIYDMIHLITLIAVAKPAQISHVRVYGRGYVFHPVFNRGITGLFHIHSREYTSSILEIRSSILSIRSVALFTQNCIPVCSAASV